jgi:hypothetical protein
METTPEAIISAFDEILDYVYGRSRGRDYPSKFDNKTAKEWIEEGLTVPIASAVFYHRMSIMHERWLRQFNPSDKTNIPQHLGLFDENIRSAIARVKCGGAPVEVWELSESRWKARLRGFFSKKLWIEDLWGPSPDKPGCRAPSDLIAEAKKTSRL